jgi:hypothetical protein
MADADHRGASQRHHTGAGEQEFLRAIQILPYAAAHNRLDSLQWPQRPNATLPDYCSEISFPPANARFSPMRRRPAQATDHPFKAFDNFFHRVGLNPLAMPALLGYCQNREKLLRQCTIELSGNSRYTSRRNPARRLSKPISSL